MATQGTLIEPYVQGALEFIDPFGYGDLITPYQVTAVDILSAPIANRFPTPPTAWAFLIDPDEEPAFDRISSAIAGAVYPESVYLEPTIGQIWPR